MPLRSIASDSAAQYGMPVYPINRMSDIVSVIQRSDPFIRSSVVRDIAANSHTVVQLYWMPHRIMAGAVEHLPRTSATTVPQDYPGLTGDDSAGVLDVIRQGASEMSGGSAIVSDLGAVTFAEDDDTEIMTLTNIVIRLPGQERNATRAFRKLFYDWMVENLSDDDLAAIAVHVTHG